MPWNELIDLARALVFPPAGPLIGALLGLALMTLTPRRRLGATACGLGLVTLWLLSLPVVSGQLMRVATPYDAIDLRQPPEAQAIVILAGGVRRYSPEYNEDAPSDATWQRLAYGARLARKTGLPVLVTGGRGEAAAMRSFLLADFGVVPTWVDESALDTQGNAEFAAALLAADGIRDVLLVTSDWHMRRAVAEFQWRGLRVTPAPVTDYAPPDGMLTRWVPGAGALRDSRRVLNEWLGLLVARLRMWSQGA